MKLTSKILLTMLVLFIAGIVMSNVALKNEYEKTDKNDLYWTYGKILEQPFSHLVIQGGNLTKIAYEPSRKPSVRVYKDWDGFEKGVVKAHVTNDTLYLTFPETYKDQYEKQYLSWNTLVRIFSAQLLSVTGINTNLELYKFNQKKVDVNISGKSYFEVETIDASLDSLHITGSDSAEIVFEMSPDVMRDGTFHVNAVDADLKGFSFLDIGHAQVDSLKLNVADSSGVLLSGGTMKKNQSYNCNKRSK
jgi:hypothetical protein